MLARYLKKPARTLYSQLTWLDGAIGLALDSLSPLICPPRPFRKCLRPPSTGAGRSLELDAALPFRLPF